jgi:RNA recognition motif-containing protein
MNIYVGNLSYNVTTDELEKVFSEYGDVSRVTIITDRQSGQSKGFGFVEMPHQEEAEAAIQSLDGNSMNGRNIKVNQARPREDRPQRGPRY